MGQLLRRSGLKRTPIEALRPFITLVWACDESAPDVLAPERERMIPTGAMHLVFRLSERPIRFFDSLDDYRGRTFNLGVVGGIRAGPYLKETATPMRTVGALLRPGASELLFGVPAHELNGCHTSIEDLWGRSSFDLWERLQEASNPQEQLKVFEGYLMKRLPTACVLHPAVAHALRRFPLTTDIGEIVGETGYSHRRFIELFRRTVGLSPRLYCRVLRFQEAVKLANRLPRLSLANVAAETGYADQAHFNREFRDFAGISPMAYLLADRTDSHHVPMPPPRG